MPNNKQRQHKEGKQVILGEQIKRIRTFLGLTKMTAALYISFSLSAIPAKATLLMINRCITMSMMFGLLMPQ